MPSFASFGTPYGETFDYGTGAAPLESGARLLPAIRDTSFSTLDGAEAAATTRFSLEQTGSLTGFADIPSSYRPSIPPTFTNAPALSRNATFDSTSGVGHAESFASLDFVSSGTRPTPPPEPGGPAGAGPAGRGVGFRGDVEVFAFNRHTPAAELRNRGRVFEFNLGSHVQLPSATSSFASITSTSSFVSSVSDLYAVPPPRRSYASARLSAIQEQPPATSL